MSIELDYKRLGKRIKSRRTEAKLTQEQLASVVDVATSNISHIERATTQVSLPTLVKIANALDVSLDQLVCDSLPILSVYLRQDFEGLLSDCSVEETQIIKDIVIATKKTLRERTGG